MKRRKFLKTSSLLSLSFLKTFLFSSGDLFARSLKKVHYLKKDYNKILDIHLSLNYKIISYSGSKMKDGFIVPEKPDGMATFKKDEKVVIIRNHELRKRHGIRSSAFSDGYDEILSLEDKHYDPKSFGGTTNIVYDEKKNKVINEFLSLSGTEANCAGGETPWGSWLTCEESINVKREKAKSHGYVFEVHPKLNGGVQDPKPLKKLGRFNHEAVAFDDYGNAYLTEDRSDGLFYKFKPKNKGDLTEGKLYALGFTASGKSDTRNWETLTYKIKEKYNIKWIPLDDVDPKQDTLREEGINKGASIFARGEGIISDSSSIYFSCTTGGENYKGQIWKLNYNKNETLELWYESLNENDINMPDNITISPWGDLIICEDNSDINRIWGISKKGKPYIIAENSYSGSEFAGVCFSPSGKTMFFNLQSNGQTFAVTGNWEKLYS